MISDSSFISFIKKTTVLSMKETLKLDKVLLINEIGDFEKKIFRIGNEQIKLSVPSPQNKYSIHKYILFLEDFTFDYRQNSFLLLPLNDFLFFLNNSDELILESKFLLWDSNVATFVSYGKLSFNTDIRSGKLKEGVKESINKFITKIFQSRLFYD